MNFVPGAMELAAEGTGVELAADLDTATTAMESKRIVPGIVPAVVEKVLHVHGWIEVGHRHRPSTPGQATVEIDIVCACQAIGGGGTLGLADKIGREAVGFGLLDGLGPIEFTWTSQMISPYLFFLDRRDFPYPKF